MLLLFSAFHGNGHPRLTGDEDYAKVRPSGRSGFVGVLRVGWELDEEHEQFRGTCRAFTDREVRPLVEHAEAEGQFPGELWKPLGAAGLLGLVTPE